MQNEKITRFSPKYHNLCFPGCKKVLISPASLMFKGVGVLNISEARLVKSVLFYTPENKGCDIFG